MHFPDLSFKRAYEIFTQPEDIQIQVNTFEADVKIAQIAKNILRTFAVLAALVCAYSLTYLPIHVGLPLGGLFALIALISAIAAHRFSRFENSTRAFSSLVALEEMDWQLWIPSPATLSLDKADKIEDYLKGLTLMGDLVKEAMAKAENQSDELKKKVKEKCQNLVDKCWHFANLIEDKKNSDKANAICHQAFDANFPRYITKDFTTLFELAKLDWVRTEAGQTIIDVPSTDTLRSGIKDSNDRFHSVRVLVKDAMQKSSTEPPEKQQEVKESCKKLADHCWEYALASSKSRRVFLYTLSICTLCYEDFEQLFPSDHAKPVTVKLADGEVTLPKFYLDSLLGTVIAPKKLDNDNIIENPWISYATLCERIQSASSELAMDSQYLMQTKQLRSQHPVELPKLKPYAQAISEAEGREKLIETLLATGLPDCGALNYDKMTMMFDYLKNLPVEKRDYLHGILFRLKEKGLRELSLPKWATDEDLKPLEGIKTLWFVFLDETQITKKGLEYLKESQLQIA